MRKIVVMAMVLILVFPVVGIAARNNVEDIVIGASLISKDNMWWANVGRFLEQAATIRGVKLIVLWAQGNPAKQLRDTEDLIQKGVNGVLLGPVHNKGSVVAIEAVHKAGIPLVQIARSSATQNFSASFVFDEKMFGVKQTEFLASRLPNGGSVVYLYGPVGASYPAIQFEGFEETLNKYPKIKLLHVFKSKVDTVAEGLRNAEDALVRYGKIDAFVGSNDDLVLGAIRAAESAGRAKEITFVGNSGLPMGMQAIYEGKMAYTSLKSQAAMIIQALDALIKIIQGKKVAKHNMVQPIPVTKENVLTVRDPVFGGTVSNPSTFRPH
ncbi:sugar ABC transporter substrate-binding protein [Acidobacteria bacterium AH-259-A15]|nr:sugar ABC transporter substrate-binding protein [Acidobacteria bacterium AH-259-A15]